MRTRAVAVWLTLVLLVGALPACRITGLVGPSTVAPGAAASFELRIRCESTGDDGVLFVAADVPDDWAATSASFEGTINGAPTSGGGSILAGAPRLLASLGPPRAGFTRVYFGFGPYAHVLNTDSGVVTLDFVAGQRTGPFPLSFQSRGATFVGAAMGTSDASWTCMVSPWSPPAGSFAAPVVTPSYQMATGIRAADLDHDGMADLIRLSSGDANTYRSLGNGAYLETSRVVLPYGSAKADAVADVNGDGNLDLVRLWYFGPDGITTYLGDEAGRFGQAKPRVRTLPEGVWFYSVLLSDVTGDGRADLILSDGWGRLWVAPGTGHGDFGKFCTVDIALPYATLQDVDVNGDGNRDILATATYPSRLVVVLSDGSGGLDIRPVMALFGDNSVVTAAELDGDGRPDLLATEHLAYAVHVLHGDGTGGFAVGASWEVGAAGLLKAADVDQDGAMDAIVGVRPRVYVLFGDGRGGFRSLAVWEPTAGSNASLDDFAVGDLNGDGLPDLTALVRHYDTYDTWLAGGVNGY